LRALPEVDTVASMRFTDTAVDGDTTTLGSLDPELISKVVDLEVVSGDVSKLDDTGVLVSDELARHNHGKVGHELPVQFSRGQAPLRVQAIYKRQNFIGLFGQSVPLIVAPETMDAGAGSNPQDTIVFVRTRGGESPATQRALQRELVSDFPNIDVL